MPRAATTIENFRTEGFWTRALRFGGTAVAGGVATEGASFALPPTLAVVFFTTDFRCFGAAVLLALSAVAGFFGGAFAAALLRALVLWLRVFPVAGDLRAACTRLVFLSAACFRALPGVLRLAACLRFLAMRTAIQSSTSKTSKAGN